MTEIDVDSFAGGGGASVGIEAATGHPVDIAINHSREAIAMHRANHPDTEHYITDIWNVDPAGIRARHGPIRLAWFSPDCTHHSKAKGRAPIRSTEAQRSRDLAWVVVHWARTARPRIIMLENVEEFQGWGPLGQDGRACPQRRGEVFSLWIAALRREGYEVRWRELRACDYGSPTIRKRLFVVARRDGRPIVWPEPTHGPGLEPCVSAAQCIDWSLPTYSIFLTGEEGRRLGRRRPLAEATLRRVARGLFKYVITARDPFTVACPDQVGRTAPYFVPRYGERPGQEPRAFTVLEPAPTIVPTGNGATLVAAHMMPYRGQKTGGLPRVRDIRDPIHTVTCEPSAAVVAAYLAQHGRPRGARAQPAPGRPVRSASKQGRRTQLELLGDTAPVALDGQRQALVEQFLTEHCRHAGIRTLTEPGLVTVHGTRYRIVDIAMRMLSPRELFLAQGFPARYEIAPVHNGKTLSQTMQIRLCGNSVCPQVCEALVRANLSKDVEWGGNDTILLAGSEGARGTGSNRLNCK